MWWRSSTFDDSSQKEHSESQVHLCGCSTSSCRPHLLGRQNWHLAGRRCRWSSKRERQQAQRHIGMEEQDDGCWLLSPEQLLHEENGDHRKQMQIVVAVRCRQKWPFASLVDQDMPSQEIQLAMFSQCLLPEKQTMLCPESFPDPCVSPLCKPFLCCQSSRSSSLCPLHPVPNGILLLQSALSRWPCSEDTAALQLWSPSQAVSGNALLSGATFAHYPDDSPNVKEAKKALCGYLVGLTFEWNFMQHSHQFSSHRRPHQTP